MTANTDREREIKQDSERKEIEQVWAADDEGVNDAVEIEQEKEIEAGFPGGLHDNPHSW